MRRVLLPLLLALLLVAAAPPASAQVRSEPVWQHGFGGAFRRGAVTVGDVSGDAAPEIVVGGTDGWVRVFDLQGRNAPGWPQPLQLGVGAPTAIDSAPTIVDLDRDGTNEIVVTGGSVTVPNQHGGIAAFAADGRRLWFRHARDVFNIWTGGGPDGFADGVSASAAAGDVDGDGYPDIVVGAFDHHIYAIDRFGRDLPGSPYLHYDTIWSSASLHDVDGDGRAEIFLGTDISRDPSVPFSFNGGIFLSLEHERGALRHRWQRVSTEAFYSSPAVADVDGDGRLEAVVGNANAFNTADSRRVWAFHLDDGSDAPGFTTPRLMPGVVLSSPAVGDLDGDGRSEAVVSDQAGYVTALRGDGNILWQVRPGGSSEIIDSPIIADLDGDGRQDVAVGNGAWMFLLRGRDGGLIAQVHENWAHQGGAAVVEHGSTRLLVAAGFRPGAGANIAAVGLPASTTRAAWPMFRRNAQHTGGPGAAQLPAGQCRPPSNPTATPSAASARGYWVLGVDGDVHAFGDATDHGGLAGYPHVPSGIAATRTGAYWLLAADGSVHGRGTAPLGDLRGRTDLGYFIDIEPTPSGRGYWIATTSGGVFPFGDAGAHGSMLGRHLNAPVISMTPTASGLGYYLVAADGGVFTFGDAVFRGSTGNLRLNAPVRSMAVAPNGAGYWLLGGDGGVFSFNVPFHGSVPGTGRCATTEGVQIRPSATSGGYWVQAVNGDIYAFGDARHLGSPSLPHARRAIDLVPRQG